MSWRTVALGAVVGVASIRFLLSKGDGGGLPPPAVRFTEVPRRRRVSRALSAPLRAEAAAARQQARSRQQGRWVSELQLLAAQLVLGSIATIVADRLFGRAHADEVFAATAVLVCALAAVAALSAAGHAILRVWRGSTQQLLASQRRRRPQTDTAAVQEAAAPVQAMNFSGVWDKDKEGSDSMEPALDAMRMSGLMRQGVALVRGLEIKQDTERFDMAVFSAIPLVKIRESYPMTGEPRQYKRRDMRRGKHQARVEVLPGGALRLHVAWPDPYGGSGSDTFTSPIDGVMHVDAIIALADQTVEYRQVYRRRAS